MSALNNKEYFKGTPKLVLIVDDKPVVREIIAVVLSMYGYRCIEASNGCEAIMMYDSHPVDLVITDIYMPQKDGLSLISELKVKDPDVKIVAMSGGGGLHFPECLEWAEALGAEGSFIKPFNHVDFVNIVDSILRQPDENQYRDLLTENVEIPASRS